NSPAGKTKWRRPPGSPAPAPADITLQIAYDGVSSMASPPIPPSLDHLITRPFSFYPAIVNIEHNEWLYRKATWSEILVVNCKSASEVWIPRRFLGDVSRVDDPVLIVGLNREL